MCTYHTEGSGETMPFLHAPPGPPGRPDMERSANACQENEKASLMLGRNRMLSGVHLFEVKVSAYLTLLLFFGKSQLSHRAKVSCPILVGVEEELAAP